MRTLSVVSKLWDDKYIPLDLPDHAKVDMARIDLRTTIICETEFDSINHGIGTLLFIIDKSQPDRFVAIGVTQNLIDAGFDTKVLIKKDRPRLYEKCWDKPTTAGVAGCVVETFIDWALS